MKPHGFSMDDANQKIQQKMVDNDFSSLESNPEAVLEKPFELTTPTYHEEL